MVAEILFGLQLVQQSCKAIKMALKSAEDISEIGGLIDNVFKGQEQLKQKAHPIASKWGKFIKGSTSDKFLQMAIQETVDEKVATEQIDKISLALNRRFGQDTWVHIILAREEKIKRYEEEMEKRRVVSRQRWAKMGEIVGVIFAVGGTITLLWLFINYARK